MSPRGDSAVERLVGGGHGCCEDGRGCVEAVGMVTIVDVGVVVAGALMKEKGGKEGRGIVKECIWPTAII